MKRRHLLASCGTFGLTAVAGCLGAAGLAEHEATPAGVAPATRAETGYEQTGIEEVAVEEEVEVSVYSETVVARNYLVEHEKAIGVEPLGEQRSAVFTVLTTPQVDVAGREFNPVREMSTRELVELIEGNYDDLENVEHERDDDVEILDQETTESRFSARAAFGGVPVDVNVHVSEAVETAEDWVVTIGVYPQQVAPREEDNVRSLMENVTEGVDDETVDSGEDGERVPNGDEVGDNESDGNHENGETDDGIVDI
ncbi:DUF6517 family protein [Natrialba sp. INN-245]|uniref:DUF6517 family protein n=1 Tax=Natrialba sp. INN-245 TaxID=2690967 RepID=UPI00131001B2|nr:DUF6517 family protein [Natrialba sp. INN-245]MWV41602.1 hypothetical protein [Natrialba sp. INN-245]